MHALLAMPERRLCRTWGVSRSLALFARALGLAFVGIVLCAAGLDAMGAQKNKDTKKQKVEVSKGAMAGDASAIPAKIKKLLKDRVAVLSEAARLAEDQYREGKVPFQVLADLRCHAIRANLDLQTPEERLAALRQLATLVEASHKILEAQYQAGARNKLDVDSSKATLLDAQTETLREALRPRGPMP